MTLSLDSVAQVSVNITQAGARARGFGNGLIVGTSAVLPLYERIRIYEELADVGTDFGTSAAEYLAAQSFFLQDPAPTQVKIGRLFTGVQAGYLKGGAVSSTVGTYTGVSNGGFDITINGVLKQLTGIDLSGAASMAAVAADLQTALAAAVASTTCVWNATLSCFIITSPTTGTSSSIGYATAPTGGGSPTDMSALLGLTGVTGALAVTGIAAETTTSGLNALKLFDPDFYGLTLTSFADVTAREDAAAWAEANKCLFFHNTADTNAPLSGATSDIGYVLKGLGYARSAGQYSTSNPYAVVSMMSRALAVNFDKPNSTITLKFKKEPGVAAEPLTPTQAAALKAKNYNYYVDRGGFNMLEEGVVANGRFIDEVMGLDWLQNAVQIAAFNELATAATKIPLTDAGTARIVHAIKRDAMDKAVKNGLVAPGTWNGEDVGEIKSGDFLGTGYYVYAEPVASQSSTDRDARVAPPITIICIGAGAIHSVQVTINFQR
jgi:hypothetical protein